MLLVREIMYCRPGKVRPMVDKFKAMAKVGESRGWGKMRVLTDVAAERYWTLVAEMEVPSMDAYMKMGEDMDSDEELGDIMRDYHDFVDSGKREIYTIEE